MADSTAEDRARLAKWVADGVEIDWEALSARGTLTPEEIQAYRLLEQARLGRGAEGTAAGDRPLEQGFDVMARIGRGSTSQVFRAVDRLLAREVALKVLDPSALSTAARESFVHEARALASLDHPNIVRIHSVDESDGRIRIALELVEGRSLTEVGEAGPLEPAEVARIGIELCQALAAIHARGLVHRDVKPSNVMRTNAGRIVLLDFGTAHALTSTQSPAGACAGTPLFMAPEQFAGRADVGPGADVFALGVLLYWLASGTYPFEGRNFGELSDSVLAGRRVPLRERRSDVPEALATAIDRALSGEPGDRYASAPEFEAALRGALGAFSAAPPPSKGKSLSARRIAAPLILLGAAAGTWLALRPGIDPSGFDFAADFYLAAPGREIHLRSGDAVEPGDQIRMEVESSRPIHLYVLDEDARGDLFALYPLPGFETQNPLPPRRSHRLPGRLRGGADQNWVVTIEGGGETLLAIAALEPLPAVEDFLRSIPAATPGVGPVAPPLSRAAREELLRGIGGTSPAAATGDPLPARGSGRRLAELVRGMGAESSTGLEVRWIDLTSKR